MMRAGGLEKHFIRIPPILIFLVCRQDLCEMLRYKTGPYFLGENSMFKVRSVVTAALTVAVSASVGRAALSVSVVPVVEGVYVVNPDGTVGASIASLSNVTSMTSGPQAYYDVHFLLYVSGANAAGPAPAITLGGVAFGLDGISRQPTFLGAGQPTQGLSPLCRVRQLLATRISRG